MKAKERLWSSVVFFLCSGLLLFFAVLSVRSGHFSAGKFTHRLVTASESPYQFWTVVTAWALLGTAAVWEGAMKWRR